MTLNLIPEISRPIFISAALKILPHILLSSLKFEYYALSLVFPKGGTHQTFITNIIES
jgi:hypothetical protein